MSARKFLTLNSTSPNGSAHAEKTPRILIDLLDRDVVVIGLQEFVPLGLMTAMLGPDGDRPKQWESLIANHLTRLYANKYVKVDSYLMMGIYSLVLVKAEVVDLISNVKVAKVKTGFQGMAENKGSVIIRYSVA